MSPFGNGIFRRALLVLAQFVVAGVPPAIDVWGVDLDTTWQMTVLALAQLSVPAPHLVPSWTEQNGEALGIVVD